MRVSYFLWVSILAVLRTKPVVTSGRGDGDDLIRIFQDVQLAWAFTELPIAFNLQEGG